ncbi:Multiple epidermal growth factor-like domains protein 8 [Linnemannia zychae]|nr:Multiple epidermal growth factor-like domains protein 8 [Linnemannia zychae]
MAPYPIDNNRYAIQQQIGYASSVCQQDRPEQFSGPNGTFATTSDDGRDPPGARTCIWSITIPGDGTSTTGPSIISLNFWNGLMLACGKDSLTVYDGPDTASPLIATLCGNYWANNAPALFSSGSQMTIVYTKSAESPVDVRISGFWSATSPCQICLASGRGLCKANTCACNPRYSGSVCQKESTGFEGFTPRSQHSMAYDSAKDMVYITGGISRGRPLWDLITYSFGNNKWNSIIGLTPSPDARYGHFSFVHKGNLFVYGGIASYGPIADLWMYDTKVWSKQLVSSLEKAPTGAVGPACVFFTANNQTQMAVFGGMTKDGVTMRELHFYDVDSRQWSLASRQNSVGLAGATAVFHQETNSIYYFGGMINQTIRNTIPYQYSLDQELWFALAPRFDPLASKAVGWNGTAYIPASSDGSDNNLDDPKGDGSGNSTTAGLQNPAMYDAVSGVWAPAALMGSDTVVFYGGMRPFGLGVTREPSCFIRNMYIYDLSCQKWSYGMSDAMNVIQTRVNHTMIVRPPGASGASKTAYTAYIFGGFDGYEHNDMINVTIDIYPTTPKAVNRCRALNWCSKYDDCQSCNPHYCSYIGGLCLFDTDKAKKPASSSAPILLGESADIPTNGTMQDLLVQQPNLKSENCPSYIQLNIMTLYAGIIGPKNSLVFKTYVDAPDYDIQFDVNTTPSTGLVFRTLNVWEGFMNMYWRANNRLLDYTWEDKDGRSTLPPDDLPAIRNSSDVDPPVITPSGTLSIVEMWRRWNKYAGLDGSPSQSALQGVSSQGIYFLAGDPRRFSGYYVYSLTNPTDIPVTISVIVNLLNRPVDKEADKGSQLDLATLGFFMVGFILGVFLLIVLGRKLRRVIAARDEAQWAAAELRMLEEEAAEEERRAAMANAAPAGGRGGEDQEYVEKKPMYRIVVGVQQEKEALLRALTPPGSAANTLRHRAVRRSAPSPLSRSGSLQNSVVTSHTGRISSNVVEDRGEEDISENLPTGRRKSDFIRDLGSSPPSSGGEPRFPGVSPAFANEPHVNEIQRRHTSGGKARNTDGPLSTLQRGLSAGRLKGSSSLKRFLSISRGQSEDKEVLTQISQETAEDSTGDVLTGSESELYGSLNKERGLRRTGSDMSMSLIPRRRLRNPIMVQPISVEPLPFHGGLVPNTRRHYRRYRRSLQRRQQRDQQAQQLNHQYQQQQKPRTPVSRSGSASRPSFSVARSLSRRNGLLSSNSTRSQSSLREAHRAASRTALRSAGGSPPSGTVMEMVPLGGSSNNNTTGVHWQGEAESSVSASGMYSHRDEQDGEHGDGAGTSEGASRMRLGGGRGGPHEYEAGPLLAVNVLIVFPGDAGTRSVHRIGSEDERSELVGYGKGKSVVRNADEDEDEVEEEDRRSQNTLYNSNNINLGVTQGSIRSSSSTGGHSSQPSSSSSSTSNTSANMSKASDIIDTEQRLPPMAIGTVFVPDPVRWWAYKAQQQVDRRRIQREFRRMWARQRQLQLQQQLQQKSPESK